MKVYYHTATNALYTWFNQEKKLKIIILPFFPPEKRGISGELEEPKSASIQTDKKRQKKMQIFFKNKI